MSTESRFRSRIGDARYSSAGRRGQTAGRGDARAPAPGPRPAASGCRWRRAIGHRAGALVESRVRPQLGLNATFRISDDDTGLWGATPSGWTVPFGRWLYANVSYGLDRWLFLRGTYPSWMHRARVAADRRFGRRWRMGLSAEVMTDAGASTQLLAMLMLGYRFGA